MSKKWVEEITQLSARPRKYIQLNTVGSLPIYLGIAGRGKEPRHPCLELKEIESQAQIQYIEENLASFEATLGHTVKWQPMGKEGNGRGIVAIYFKSRPVSVEEEGAWAMCIYPSFLQIAEKITKSRG